MSVAKFEVEFEVLRPGEASPLKEPIWSQTAYSRGTGSYSVHCDPEGLLIELRSDDGRRVCIDLERTVEQVGEAIFKAMA